MISIFSILILLLAFFSLIILMIIHEFGHFIIAKKFGVEIEEFGIGYPPRIWGKKVGETIYSINWVPLGAFVRIHGEEGGVDDIRSFTSLKIWKRVLIIIGGVAAFWLASIAIFSILFAVGSDLPVSDDQVQGITNPRIEVISVLPNSPADKAGLMPGDILLEIQSQRYESAQYGPEVLEIEKIKDFQEFTKSHAGEQLDLEIKRGQEILSLSLSPRVDPPEGEGAVGIGLQRMATLIEKYPWYQAPIQGAIYTWQVTAATVVGIYTIFANLFSGQGMPQGAEFAGPLGITVFLANAASYGAGFFLYFVGTLSVCIAVFNVFPIPALDGGKLVFLAIEKIRGRPVSVKVEQIITLVCFALLILLSVYITVRFDVPRFSNYFTSAINQSK